jgi:hypothetical protein
MKKKIKFCEVVAVPTFLHGSEQNGNKPEDYLNIGIP